MKEDSFGLFGWVGRGEGRMLEEGGERRRAGGGRRGAGRGGGEAEEWEQRRKRGDGAGSGGRAKGEGVQPERAEQRGASEGRRQSPGRGCGSLVNSRPGSGAFLTLEIFAGRVSCGLGGGTGLWIFGGMFCVGFWLLRRGGVWFGFDLDGKDIITIFVQQS